MKLVEVTIQGAVLKAALLNPEVVKKYEDGFHTVIQKFREAQNEKVGSDGIRKQCQAVIDYVTDIFGEDGARAVFGAQTDLLTCMDVMEEMQCLYEVQVNPIIREKSLALKEKLGAAAEGEE